MITLKEVAKRYRHFLKDPAQVIKIKPSSETECPHCKFIETLGDVQSNREYWIITEIFVYLHDGKDYCNWGKK